MHDPIIPFYYESEHKTAKKKWETTMLMSFFGFSRKKKNTDIVIGLLLEKKLHQHL